MNAAIIGSGFGGLALALRLSNSGYDVEVFEKNKMPGGKAFQFNANGFRFDTGPSLITMTFVIENLFKDLGLNLNDFLELQKLNVNCKYFYYDKTEFTAYSNTVDFVNEISTKFGETKKSIQDFLEYSKNIYELTSDIFLYNSLHQPSTYFSKKAIKALLNLGKIDVNRTMDSAIRKFFKNPKTHQFFSRYATYNGSNPYQAPATLNIIQHVENQLGAYVNKKGIYNIVEVLYSLAKERGIKFHFNTEVNKIVTENKKAVGISINNEVRKFDKIISNVDVSFTYNKLLNDHTSNDAIKYSKMEPSSSALIFLWGINGSYDQLEIHNILFSEDYEKEFNDLFIKHSISVDPTIYIYVSSKFNKHDAPLNHENWFVMINTPPNKQQDWNKIIPEYRTKIISKINQVLNIDLSDKIVFEKVITPKDLEQNTNSSYGSIYGISSNSKRSAFLRQRNESKKYKDLFFVGGSAHPGGGIPLVLLSAEITSRLIIKSK